MRIENVVHPVTHPVTHPVACVDVIHVDPCAEDGQCTFQSHVTNGAIYAEPGLGRLCVKVVSWCGVAPRSTNPPAATGSQASGWAARATSGHSQSVVHLRHPNRLGFCVDIQLRSARVCVNHAAVVLFHPRAHVQLLTSIHFEVRKFFLECQPCSEFAIHSTKRTVAK